MAAAEWLRLVSRFRAWHPISDPEGVTVPRAYKLYTDAERRVILATGLRERPSATAIHRRFGVKPVTYYSWRMKAGIKSTRGRRPRRQGDGSASDNSSGQE